ncbi:MAG: hypothetical protein M1820_003452 [Bogoriella megaspora]|nr:MAG: hypothetical protein M1820_003452 [Bogoriella megaspora]
MAQRNGDYEPYHEDPPENIYPGQRPQLNGTVTVGKCGCPCNMGDGGEQRDADNASEWLTRNATPSELRLLPRSTADYNAFNGWSEGVERMPMDPINHRTPCERADYLQHVPTRCGSYLYGPQGFQMQTMEGHDVLEAGLIYTAHELDRDGTPDSMDVEEGSPGELSRMSSSGILSHGCSSPGTILPHTGGWIEDTALVRPFSPMPDNTSVVWASMDLEIDDEVDEA